MSYQDILQILLAHPRLRLFLDYDGTLADFRDSPDQVDAQPEVINLLEYLRDCGKIKLVILSGRWLTHLQALIPVKGITLAGTYGLEIQRPDGTRQTRLDLSQIRPALDALKPAWAELITKNEGFFLEDKSWSLALHARFAEEKIADSILKKAQEIALEKLESNQYHILPGHRFLEVGPLLADKGAGVKYLLEIEPLADESLLYLGDDDKDEKAFKVVQTLSGGAIRVCTNLVRQPIEDWRLSNPQAARKWLRSLPDLLV